MRMFKNLFKKNKIQMEDVTEVVESVEVDEEITPSEINEDGELTNASETQDIQEVIDSVQDSIEEKINLEFAITELKEQLSNLVSRIEEKDVLILDLENKFDVLDSEYKLTLEKLAEVEKENDEKIAKEVASICTSQALPVEKLPDVVVDEPMSLLDKCKKLKGKELVAFYEKNKQELFNMMKQ